MKELEKLSEEVLRKSARLVKSFSYEKGELNAKVNKDVNKETKASGICLVLGMLIINILSTNKIKDKDNIKMLKELHKIINRCFKELKIIKEDNYD